ncbi:MAG: RNA-binding protein, partial [Dehalococcoidia bacterium]
IEDQAEAQAAIDGLNRKEFEGRTLDLSEARPFSQGRRNSKPYGGARGGGPARGHGGGSSGGRKRRPF